MLLPAAFTLRGLTWAALEQRAARPAAEAKGGGAAAAAAAAGEGASKKGPDTEQTFDVTIVRDMVGGTRTRART